MARWSTKNVCFFSYWPPASGNLMPIENVFLDILTEFDEHETHVHSKKGIWEEIQSPFAAVTEKEDYVKNLISKIIPNLRKIEESNSEI
jgi:oligoribonuclease (3'-5' exoribonuclease)